MILDDIYLCPICKKWYDKSNAQGISCAVLHSPGTCCHYMEQELDAQPS